MSDTEFDLRVERVKKAADVIGSLPTKGLQAEAFRYLLGEFAALPPKTKVPVAPTPVDEKAALVKDGKTRRASGTKTTITQDRDLDLFPKDKTSFKDFATAKSPKINDERYPVAVYWLREVAGHEKATVAQVVTCYRAAGWSLPSNVNNAASKAVNAGYLSSGKAEDLQLSSLGINLVDNDLPRAKA
jgi:hypothetical protein